MKTQPLATNNPTLALGYSYNGDGSVVKVLAMPAGEPSSKGQHPEKSLAQPTLKISILGAKRKGMSGGPWKEV